MSISYKTLPSFERSVLKHLVVSDVDYDSRKPMSAEREATFRKHFAHLATSREGDEYLHVSFEVPASWIVPSPKGAMATVSYAIVSKREK